MAGTQQAGGKGGKVPPRPGGSRPSVPKRPTPAKPGSYGPGRPGRPVPRASARRAVQQRRQRNLYMAAAAAGVVIVVIIVIVAINLAGGPSSKAKKGGAVVGTFPLPASLFSQVTGVPAKDLILAAEAEPADTAPPDKLPAKTPPTTAGGKPEILYIGAEFCPYCAAERWSLVMALSKFGTFGNVTGTTSSATDVNASTPTFSFYGSTYTSPYLSFVPVELESNTKATLQNPTNAENAIWEKWDAPPYVSASAEGSIPFVYMDGKYLLTGNQYDAGQIAGWQMQTAVNYMTAGNNTTSKDAEAAAGYLVSDLCTLTHNEPAAVCNQVPTWLRGVTTSSPVHHGSSSVVK